MNIGNMKEELRIAGFTVNLQEVEVVKNSVVCKGIRVDNLASPNVSPIIYYSETDTEQSVLERILGVLMIDGPKMDVHRLEDPEYFAGNVYLAIVQHGGEPDEVLTRRYLNLDVIMKLVVYGEITEEAFGTTRVCSGMLEMLGIDEDAAWKMASANSYKTAEIFSMADTLGLPEEFAPEMYIATANNNHDGACAICFPHLFQEFMEAHGFPQMVKSLLILPSSTEEMIFIPERSETSMDELLGMVSDVNTGFVDPKLQLAPAVYRYSYDDNSISLAAEL